MGIGEDLRAVALLLADGRQGRDGDEFDLQAGGLGGVAADGHVMGARPRGSVELSVDAMTRILAWPGGRRFGQLVGLHAHEQARAQILSETEQFEDVALPVGHVHAALRSGQQRHRLTQVLEPAVALLGLNGHAHRVHVSLERPDPLELCIYPAWAAL